MSNHTIKIQWGRVIPGRESMGVEFFLSAMNHYKGLVDKGELSACQTFLNTDGNLEEDAGFMLLTGSEEQITTMVHHEKHREMIYKSNNVISNLRISHAVTGNLIEDRVKKSVSWRKDLGL